jgi:RNA recognition motif-containing protein
LGDHFQPCGEIKSIRFSKNWKTKQFKGFGYIEFKEYEGVVKALELDGKDINGRTIQVDFDVSKGAKASYVTQAKEEGNKLYNKEDHRKIENKRLKKEREKAKELKVKADKKVKLFK